MTLQKDNPDKRTEAAELAAIQRNAVTVPADKLAELQRKAKLVDELVEALTLMLLDTNGKEWIDSDVSDVEWDSRISDGKARAFEALAKAKEEL